MNNRGVNRETRRLTLSLLLLCSVALHASDNKNIDVLTIESGGKSVPSISVSGTVQGVETPPVPQGPPIVRDVAGPTNDPQTVPGGGSILNIIAAIGQASEKEKVAADAADTAARIVRSKMIAPGVINADHIANPEKYNAYGFLKPEYQSPPSIPTSSGFNVPPAPAASPVIVPDGPFVTKMNPLQDMNEMMRKSRVQQEFNNKIIEANNRYLNSSQGSGGGGTGCSGAETAGVATAGTAVVASQTGWGIWMCKKAADAGNAAKSAGKTALDILAIPGVLPVVTILSLWHTHTVVKPYIEELEKELIAKEAKQALDAQKAREGVKASIPNVEAHTTTLPKTSDARPVKQPKRAKASDLPHPNPTPDPRLRGVEPTFTDNSINHFCNGKEGKFATKSDSVVQTVRDTIKNGKYHGQNGEGSHEYSWIHPKTGDQLYAFMRDNGHVPNAGCNDKGKHWNNGEHGFLVEPKNAPARKPGAGTKKYVIGVMSSFISNELFGNYGMPTEDVIPVKRRTPSLNAKVRKALGDYPTEPLEVLSLPPAPGEPGYFRIPDAPEAVSVRRAILEDRALHKLVANEIRNASRQDL